MEEEISLGEEIGVVVDYYKNVQAAGIKLEKGTLKAGDRIRIKGHTTDLEQTIDSMQINNQPIQEAGSGDDIGIKVTDRVRKGDKVYKIS